MLTNEFDSSRNTEKPCDAFDPEIKAGKYSLNTKSTDVDKTRNTDNQSRFYKSTNLYIYLKAFGLIRSIFSLVSIIAVNGGIDALLSIILIGTEERNEEKHKIATIICLCIVKGSVNVCYCTKII